MKRAFLFGGEAEFDAVDGVGGEAVEGCGFVGVDGELEVMVFGIEGDRVGGGAGEGDLRGVVGEAVEGDG